MALMPLMLNREHHWKLIELHDFPIYKQSSQSILHFRNACDSRSVNALFALLRCGRFVSLRSPVSCGKVTVLSRTAHNAKDTMFDSNMHVDMRHVIRFVRILPQSAPKLFAQTSIATHIVRHDVRRHDSSSSGCTAANAENKPPIYSSFRQQYYLIDNKITMAIWTRQFYSRCSFLRPFSLVAQHTIKSYRTD